MNHEAELLETIQILSNQLLCDPDFCGSTPGRRLRELLWILTSTSQTHQTLPRVTEQVLVNRTLSLPIDLDNALSIAVEQTGVSRNALITGAITAIIAEKRLT